jgi:peptide/nickel transport system substrate-binding protein
MRTMTRRELGRMALGAAVAGGIATVGRGRAVAQGARYGGTIVHVLPNEPHHLIPPLTSSSITAAPASAVIEGLVSLRYQNNQVVVVPELAKSWTLSPDGLTYTVQLREAKWHDGKPFTSQDVKFTLEEVTKEFHPLGRIAFQNLDRVDAVSSDTVRIRLKKPFAPFIQMMSVGYGFGGIVPKHIYAGTDILKNPANRQPVGTGPFKFQEWVRGNQIAFVRNPDYWKPERPYLDRVVVKIVPDTTTLTNGLIAGEIDQAEWVGIPYSQIPRLRRASLTFSEVPQVAAGLYFMEFNLRHPILKNKQVRKAMALAIDLDQLQRLAFYGLSRKATAHLSSTLGDAYWNPAKPLEQYRFDIAKANGLLDQAGHPRQADGTRFTLNLDYSSLLEFEKTSTDVLVKQLAQVGIRIVPRRLEYAAWLETVYNKWEFDLCTHTLNSGPFPELYASRLYLSSNIKKGVAFSNAMGYENPEIDTLFAEGTYASDEKRRRDIFYKIQTILADDLPVLPLWEVYYPLPTANRFRPAALSPLAAGGEWLWSEVWDTQAKRSKA